MRHRPAVLSCLALFLLFGCGAAWAANHSVTVGPGSTFSPNVLNIAVGDTVTWTNTGGGLHSVLSDDDEFSSGGLSNTDWVYSHRFDTEGTFRYHCVGHGAPGGLGMSGRIVVAPQTGGNDEPGVLGLSLGAYTVNEGGGTVTITVRRTGGDDGAVSVRYATAGGTAVAGTDFTPASGTLNWADGDDSNKTFTVAITNDSADENNESFNVTLSDVTVATIDLARRTATVTIQDNDGGGNPGGGAPAAPSGLTAVANPGSPTTAVLLNWNDNSNNETGFRIERRTLTGTFQEVASVPAGTTSQVVAGLTPGTQYLFRVRAANGANFSPYSNEAGAATSVTPAPCVEGPTTLCLNDDRFKAEVAWRIPNGNQGSGRAVPVPTAPDSGLFYFFEAANIEMLVKVLDACPLNNRFWVFYAATTNVQFTLTVTDTQTGAVKVYFNPLNQAAAPVQDTSAFATCP